MASFSNKYLNVILMNQTLQIMKQKYLFLDSESLNLTVPITNLSSFIIGKVISDVHYCQKIKRRNSDCRGGKEETRWFSTENNKVSQY